MERSASETELYYTTLSLLARMALRIGRDDALRTAASSLADQASGFPDSPFAVFARCASAMLEPDRAAAANLVAAMAGEFEAMDLRLAAADAYADAAWLAERAGIPSAEWTARAEDIYDACSAIPLLDSDLVGAGASPTPPPVLEGEPAT